MSENNLDNIIYSKNVIEFITDANEYCLFVEKISDDSNEIFMGKSLKLLSLLYLKSLMLIKPESVTGYDVEKFVSEADWIFIDQNVTTALGGNEIFIELTEPANPNETLSISISECFADIYQDLKDFTQLYQLGSIEAVNEGLWECANNFEQVWGSRLLAILSKFHNLLHEIR